MEPLYHDITRRQLSAIKPNPASYLFIGRSGSGRRLAAIQLARRLNCPAGGSDACAICQNILAGSFTDLKMVDGSAAVRIEQIQELQQNLAQRPFAGDTIRLIIVDVSLGISREAQSRLLKTLEEPPPQTIIVVLAESPEALLETVRSRCRVIHFMAPSRDQLNRYLTEKISAEAATLAMRLAPASIGEAIDLAGDPEAQRLKAEELRFAQRFVDAPIFWRMVMSGQVKSKQRGLNLITLIAEVIHGSRDR